MMDKWLLKLLRWVFQINMSTDSKKTYQFSQLINGKQPSFPNIYVLAKPSNSLCYVSSLA